MLLTLLFMFSVGLATPAHAAIPIAYTTDLEGHASHWTEFTDVSDAFTRVSNGRPALRPGWHVVYGGDVMDRHPGEIELLEAMVPLAELHPKSVHLLLGNRDVNKMRLIRAPVPEARMPELVRDYLERRNAGRLFEGHRQQLVARRQGASDWNVARSLVGLLGPRGLLRRYIQNAKVAYALDGTLFVHGAWRASHATYDLHQTLERLNGWKTRQVEQWIRSDGLYGEDFIKKHGDPNFVFYSSYSDESWNPTWPSEADLEYLKAAGIRRIVVGHRSYGETPALLRRDDFEMIFADTSECRGCGVPVVEIRGDHTRIRTRLSDGRAVDFSFRRGEHSPLGRWTKDHRLVVGKTLDGSWITFRNPGHVSRVIPVDDLVFDGETWVVTSRPREISGDEFGGAIGAEDARVRVEALRGFDGPDLSKFQTKTLIARGFTLTDTFEILHYLRLAAESGDADWVPLVARLHQRFEKPRRRSEDLLEATARLALARLGCGPNLERP